MTVPTDESTLTAGITGKPRVQTGASLTSIIIISTSTDDFSCDSKFNAYKIISTYIQSINLFRVRVEVFNATFNNISVISWRSILSFEENGVPGKIYQPVASH